MILIADDEPLIRQVLRTLLASAGFRVREAASGEEALAICREDRPSLVISDINMPGNDDLAFVRGVAGMFPGLPVILLTAYPSVETAVESVNLSVVAYLVKPPDASKVLDAVRHAVGTYEARESVRRSLARLKSWTQDLEQIERLMAGVRSGTGGDESAAGAYLEVTLRHLMSSVLEFRDVVSALAAAPAGAESVRALELSKAVHETVEVLEKTKRVFKSKDLGELRQKLEAVLAAAGK
ncbi:MAG: response regulator [Opitutaceae bacterium]|nr:response regulator [Opitutaceae bacterium]